MKHLPNIAGILLGFAFLAFGINHFHPFLPKPAAGDVGPHAANFFIALKKSGYLDFIKVCEIIGGLVVALPKTRNFGLLVLGPIVINIIAINIIIKGHGAIFAPPVIIISALSAYLLWAGRKKFLNLAEC